MFISGDPTKTSTDNKVGKNCRIETILNCGTPTLPPPSLCSLLPELEALIPDAVFTCLADDGKKQTVECETADGQTFRKSGKKKTLVKWAGAKCRPYGVFTCQCAEEVTVFKSVTCKSQDVYTCMQENGLMTTFKATKCKKIAKKSKCARRN